MVVWRRNQLPIDRKLYTRKLAPGPLASCSVSPTTGTPHLTSPSLKETLRNTRSSLCPADREQRPGPVSCILFLGLATVWMHSSSSHGSMPSLAEQARQFSDPSRKSGQLMKIIDKYLILAASVGLSAKGQYEPKRHHNIQLALITRLPSVTSQHYAPHPGNCSLPSRIQGCYFPSSESL